MSENPTLKEEHWTVKTWMEESGEYKRSVQPYEPTELDLIKLELRDLLASVGELRLGMNAMVQRLADHEDRIKALEAKAIDTDRRIYTGAIQGLEDEWTVTPPPEFEGEEVEHLWFSKEDIDATLQAWKKWEAGRS